MSVTRRKFLSNVGVGALGTAGLLLPAKASAFHRRRSGSGPVCYPAPVPAHSFWPRFVDGPIAMSFPTAASGNVAVANGTFFTWGVTVGQNVSVGGVQITTDAAGQTTLPGSAAPIRMTMSGNAWGFQIGSLQPGATFYLFFTVGVSGTMQNVSYGPYTAVYT